MFEDLGTAAAFPVIKLSDKKQGAETDERPKVYYGAERGTCPLSTH
jgi:hypothetical protein